MSLLNSGYWSRLLGGKKVEDVEYWDSFSIGDTNNYTVTKDLSHLKNVTFIVYNLLDVNLIVEVRPEFQNDDSVLVTWNGNEWVKWTAAQNRITLEPEFGFYILNSYVPVMNNMNFKKTKIKVTASNAPTSGDISLYARGTIL